MVSNNIVFLLRNVKLLLGNALDRVVYPFLAGVISLYKSLLFTEHLVALS